VGKYPSPALKILLRGISEGVFHKALITFGSRGVFPATVGDNGEDCEAETEGMLD
jgi:hypothetical protein